MSGESDHRAPRAERSPPEQRHRLERIQAASLQPWKHKGRANGAVKNATLDCGWGRLLFGHTFSSNEELAAALKHEDKGTRDIALYVAEPHVLLSLAPQDLFLDPSHGYRLHVEHYRSKSTSSPAYRVRKLQTLKDAEAVNRIYARRHMVTLDPSFVYANRTEPALTYLVAEDTQTKQIIGTITGVDHVEAFDDPERATSLWALAVDPQTSHPGVGRALVVHLIEHFMVRGRAYIDLSVMYDNSQAIRLYESLGFARVPVFVVKNKNRINEPLFLGQQPAEELNPYAQIITTEARRRGIAVDVLDAEQAYFSLSFGGRTLTCRESLSELTSAIAMSRCDDKRVTHRCLSAVGLRVPAQVLAVDEQTSLDFLQTYGNIVVKPARGEQGVGVSVGISTPEEMAEAIARAEQGGGAALLEEMVVGMDLRIVVIDFRVVAAAIRRPPDIVGDGKHTIEQLIEKQSRRRAAATGGESKIPLDSETMRCVQAAGYTLDEVLPPRTVVEVRKAANLHTGGTIHDVTDELHPHLVAVAKRAAEVLDIPVVGLDLMVPSVRQPDYWIIEANERPGLANHEPQPTAERFIDLLFPQTVSSST